VTVQGTPEPSSETPTDILTARKKARSRKRHECQPEIHTETRK
jgi:hypothetical protein